VEGEVIWEGPDGYYHHYPNMPRVRSWLAGAGFTIDREAEGPWHREGYAYHHVLAVWRSRQAEGSWVWLLPLADR
jgi:hypothetical protein